LDSMELNIAMSDEVLDLHAFPNSCANF